MRRIIYILFTIVLIACSQDKDERLIRADVTMTSDPALALSILDSINPEELTSDHNRALYSLLITQARTQINWGYDGNNNGWFDTEYMKWDNVMYDEILTVLAPRPNN